MNTHLLRILDGITPRSGRRDAALLDLRFV